MDEGDVRKFLEAVRRGSLPVESAVEQLRQWPYEDLGFAKIDHHRALRQGFPEVIFARKKTAKQVAEIARGMLRAKASHNILITHGTEDFCSGEEGGAGGAVSRAIGRDHDFAERGESREGFDSGGDCREPAIFQWRKKRW